jgi:hypothetical protein
VGVADPRGTIFTHIVPSERRLSVQAPTTVEQTSHPPDSRQLPRTTLSKTYPRGWSRRSCARVASGYVRSRSPPAGAALTFAPAIHDAAFHSPQKHGPCISRIAFRGRPVYLCPLRQQVAAFDLHTAIVLRKRWPRYRPQPDDTGRHKESPPERGGFHSIVNRSAAADARKPHVSVGGLPLQPRERFRAPRCVEIASLLRKRRDHSHHLRPRPPVATLPG